MDKEQLSIYQSASGDVQLRYNATEETFWITQKQLADIFDVNIRTINEHIQNIYHTNELDENATLRNFRIVQTEGKREVKREINHYNLDVAISVGYRVNSQKATAFRRWATKVLKQYLMEGYAINKVLLEQKREQAQKALAKLQSLINKMPTITSEQTLELIKAYSHTWLILDHFDCNNLPTEGKTKKEILADIKELQKHIALLREELIKKGEASELFATEKETGSLAGIYGNVMQEVFEKKLYETLEEQAAHLLYFIIKNHPFNDGNKRSGAFAFLWFLNKCGYDTSFITPSALAVLTLLVAMSAPSEKQQIIGLILEILGGEVQKRYNEYDF